MLEIYMHAVSNSTADDFLDAINLGIGNYDDAEYWQQVESFRNGLYADSAMTRTIIERAKLQTQRRIVDAIYDEGRNARILRHIDHPDPEDMTKEQYFDEHMEDVWEDLGVDTAEVSYTTHEHQAWLVHVCTGLDMNWTPPHWRMLKARHEASRSKDARLIDNLFGRPPEPDMRPMEDFS
jgi:hypothetical protein